MSDRCDFCGHRKQWSGPSHEPDCFIVRGPDPCPAHPSEDRYDCAACDALVDERKEARRGLDG